MSEPDQASATVLRLGSGARIRAPGPIAAFEVHERVIAVLIRWVDSPLPGGLRRLRGNNLYGFDEEGRRLWRVHLAKSAKRPLLLTGFLEDSVPFTLHEAHGWWVHVDPSSGLVVKTDYIA